MPENLADLILALAILAPVVGALTGTVRRAGSGRTAMISTAVALVAAAAVVVAAGADAPAAWSLDRRLLVEADRLGALLLVFVLSATVVVQA